MNFNIIEHLNQYDIISMLHFVIINTGADNPSYSLGITTFNHIFSIYLL